MWLLHFWRSENKVCVWVGVTSVITDDSNYIRDICNYWLPPWEAEIKWLKIVIISYFLYIDKKKKGDNKPQAKEVRLKHQNQVETFFAFCYFKFYNRQRHCPRFSPVLSSPEDQLLPNYSPEPWIFPKKFKTFLRIFKRIFWQIVCHTLVLQEYHPGAS